MASADAPQVWNRHHGRTPKGAVFVGRGSKWGNPYKIGERGQDGRPMDRRAVIEAFRQYLCDSPQLQEALGELRGKHLECFCKPFPCHGDVLLEMANRPAPMVPRQAGPTRPWRGVQDMALAAKAAGDDEAVARLYRQAASLAAEAGWDMTAHAFLIEAGLAENRLRGIGVAQGGTYGGLSLPGFATAGIIPWDVYGWTELELSKTTGLSPARLGSYEAREDAERAAGALRAALAARGEPPRA